MNSQHSGLTNSAIAAAVVGVLAWMATYWHVTVPDQIQNDMMVLIAWGAGYLLNKDPRMDNLAADVATIANAQPVVPQAP